MAKNRYINTEFWRDEYIENLDPLERYLFLYCLTNPLTTIAGVYKISLKRMSFETGLDQDMLIKLFNRFEKSNKIIYFNGWVGIRNFIKHQSSNPKILKGIELELVKAPLELVEWVKSDSLSKPIDSLSKPIDSLSKPLNYINPNININTNTNEEEKEPMEKETIDIREHLERYIDNEEKQLSKQPLKEKERKTSAEKKEKETYYENVRLTLEEYNKFVAEYGKQMTEKIIKYLSDYKIEKDYKTKSDYLTIRRWVIDACKIQPIQNTEIKYDTDLVYDQIDL